MRCQALARFFEAVGTERNQSDFSFGAVAWKTELKPRVPACLDDRAPEPLIHTGTCDVSAVRSTELLRENVCQASVQPRRRPEVTTTDDP